MCFLKCHSSIHTHTLSSTVSNLAITRKMVWPIVLFILRRRGHTQTVRRPVLATIATCFGAADHTRSEYMPVFMALKVNPHRVVSKKYRPSLTFLSASTSNCCYKLKKEQAQKNSLVHQLVNGLADRAVTWHSCAPQPTIVLRRFWLRLSVSFSSVGSEQRFGARIR